MAKVGVYIVDDHEIVRQGLRALIGAEPNMRVVGEAASGEEALDAYLTLCPDVVVMDISMAGMGGIEATRRLRAKDPNARIVGLSMHADAASSRAMREAGCLGFVNKAAAFSDLVLAIRAANAGMPFPDDESSGGNAADIARNDIGLTMREQEVLSIIGRGHTNEEIAEALQISIGAVLAHRRNIMSKLRLQPRSPAAV